MVSLSLPNRRWVLALLPAGVIVWLLTAQPGGPPPDAVETTVLPPEESYEAFGRGIRTEIYDDSGLLSYTLTAAEQRMFADRVTDLDLPLLQAFEQGQERWNISALSGRIRASSGGDIQQFDLRDNVQVLHETPAGDTMRLTTNWLTLLPVRERLYTNAQVQVQGEGIEQTAKGMRADLTLDQLEFLSDIQGRYHRADP